MSTKAIHLIYNETDKILNYSNIYSTIYIIRAPD